MVSKEDKFKTGIATHHFSYHTPPMNHAFSLFELLIVMAIIGILAAISYPIYTQHIAEVNCKQARVALLEIANKIEQEYNLMGNYSQLNIESLTVSYTQLPYRFSLHTAKNNYQIIADALKPKNFTPACRRLVLNHAENSVLIP